MAGLNGRLTLLAQQPAAVRGALWMVLACACFSSMNGMVRYLSVELEPMVIVFFRCLFGTIAIAPWLAHAGLSSLRTSRPLIQGARAIIAVVAMAAWFYGLSLMPLAEAIALSFTMPLFASIAAVVFLGEVMRARRWSATVIGFVGAMIILRPGFAELTLATGLILGAAVLMSITQTMVKMLTATEHPNAIVFWLAFLLTPLSLVPALVVWQTPTLGQLAWLLGLGALATLAHQSLTRALAASDATAVLPLDFMRLPFAAAIGYFAFAEVPDLWTWTGAAVIVLSSVYISHREARLRRARRAAADGKADEPAPAGGE